MGDFTSCVNPLPDKKVVMKECLKSASLSLKSPRMIVGNLSYENEEI